MSARDENERLELIRTFNREELSKVLVYAEENYFRTVDSFMCESLRGLRKTMGATKFQKQLIRQMKRQGTVAICRLDNNVLLEKGLYFHQTNDFASEIVYSIGRLCEPCLEHIDNNFNPLTNEQKKEFTQVANEIMKFVEMVRLSIEDGKYTNAEACVAKANTLNNSLSQLKKEELKRLQHQSGSIKVSMVYLTIIQESQNVVNYALNLMKVSRKFQQD